MNEVCLKTRAEWRNWLAKNHDKSAGVWLVFYKKHTGKPTLDYDDVVEEALCFGWIDSIIRRLDEDRYARKLTPRKADSQWSESNKQRVKKLLRKGLITEVGSCRIEEAKKSGRWAESARPQIPEEMPTELKQALAKSKKARSHFEKLTKNYQKHYIGWIATAKREGTRERRAAEAIALLEQGKKLGLK